MQTMQLVIFKLNDQEYGLDIFNVREIGPYRQPTQIPNSPDYIEGILNLRGDIIPIINLKKRFNVQEGNLSEKTRIIVINSGQKMMGIIADEASEVLTMDIDQIDSVWDMTGIINRRFISGIGKRSENENMLIILNIEAIVTENAAIAV